MLDKWLECPTRLGTYIIWLISDANFKICKCRTGQVQLSVLSRIDILSDSFVVKKTIDVQFISYMYRSTKQHSSSVLRCPGCQRFFSRWGRQNIERRSGEVLLSPTSTTRSEAPRRWRARKPLASRVVLRTRALINWVRHVT